MIHYRKWYCWALVMGCTWEACTTSSLPSPFAYSFQLFGFILRIVSIKYPTEIKYYVRPLHRFLRHF
jgi:hypothetical protein